MKTIINHKQFLVFIRTFKSNRITKVNKTRGQSVSIMINLAVIKWKIPLYKIFSKPILQLNSVRSDFSAKFKKNVVILLMKPWNYSTRFLIF